MGRFFRFAGIAVGVLVLVLVAAIGIFVATFDPNDLKGRIVEAVREQTGRELTIEGEIGLSIFPYVGFTLGPTRLGDASGFGDDPFVRFERAAASVRLLPLLTSSIQVGELRLEGFTLKAVTRADGVNNWDDLVAAAGSEGSGAAPASGGGDGGQASSFDPADLTIGGVTLRDANLSYEDRRSGTRYQISDWNLNTGEFRLGQPVDLETKLTLKAQNPDLDGTITARGTLTPDAARTVLATPRIEVAVSGAMLQTLSSLDVTVEAERLAIETAGPFALQAPTIRAQAGSPDFGEPLDARIEATAISGDLQRQTLKLDQLTATAWGLRMDGALTGSKIIDGPELKGNLAIAPFSPKDVAARAGAPLPPTVDPEALTRASLTADVEITPTSATFSSLDMTLDDTRLTGRLAVTDLERQALRFDLQADQLVLDRYMSPASEQPAAEGSSEDAAIPAEDIRSADIDGRLRADQLMLAGLTATQLDVTLKAQGGVLRIHPSRAQMYGGSYEGDIRIDASGEVPTLSLNERLQQVDFGALGADVFDNQKLNGTLDGRVTLSGSGVTQSAIVSTLGGDAQFSFVDGALLGVDIPFEIRRAAALLGRGDAPTGGSSGRTEFAELTGTAQVTSGVLRNDDLVVRLPAMLGNGRGTVDLRNDALDYTLEMRFQKSAELPRDVEQLVGVTIPVALTGTLSDPRVDAAEIGKALAKRALEKEAGKVIDKALGEGAAKGLRNLLGGESGGEAEGEDSGGGAGGLGGMLKRLGESQKKKQESDDPPR